MNLFTGITVCVVAFLAYASFRTWVERRRNLTLGKLLEQEGETMRKWFEEQVRSGRLR